jgi:hypothetical protein
MNEVAVAPGVASANDSRQLAPWLSLLLPSGQLVLFQIEVVGVLPEKSAPVRLVLVKFVAVNVALVKSTAVSADPEKSLVVRVVFAKVVFINKAFVALTLVNVAPLKFALVMMALVIITPVMVTPVRLAPVRMIPLRVAPVRVHPDKSTPAPRWLQSLLDADMIGDNKRIERPMTNNKQIQSVIRRMRKWLSQIKNYCTYI